MRRHFAGIASAAALALLVTGCGDTGPDDETNGSSEGTEGDAADDTAAETLPLATGTETATWTDRDDREYEVEISAESLTRGEADDLEDVRLDEEHEGLIPHYVTITVTALGNSIPAPAVEDGLALVTTDGRAAEPLSLMSFGGDSDYPGGCDQQTPDTLAADESAEICQMFLLHEEAEPLRVGYSDDGSAPALWAVEGAEMPETVRELGSAVESGWTDSDDTDVPIEVSAASVTEGTVEDLADWDVDTDGKVPYYVTMEYRNDGEPDLYPRMNEGVELWTLSGQTARPVTLLDVYGRGVDACPKAVPDEMLAPGDTVQECSIYLIDEGDTPSVVYHMPRGEAPGARAWDAGLA